MKRNEGLVQRRVTQGCNSNTNKAINDLKDGNDGDVGKQSKCEDDNDADSKDTRLTLMEEVLLLGLKDKEVRICVHLKTESRFHPHTQWSCFRLSHMIMVYLCSISILLSNTSYIDTLHQFPISLLSLVH